MNHYRQHLQCKYESLRLTSPDEMLDCCSSRYISLTLVKAGEEAKTDSRYINENERDGNVTLTEALDVESEKQNVILFEGAAGIGKSTLAINICKQWAKGNLLQGYDAVILLPLRDPEIQDAKGIGDLLLVSGEMKEKILNEITINNGERVCFIFEGYDELPQPLQKVPVFAKLTEKLPKCTLIYTSRPEACADLRTIACRAIKIDGFTEELIDDYITQTFDSIKNGGKEMASRLKSQLHDNLHMKRILHIPINVAIVCLVFFHFSVLPDTLTQLYTLLCLRLILRHINTRTSNTALITKLDSLDNLPEDVSKQFDDLCLIAYTGIKKDTIIFSFKFLNDIGVTVDKLNGLGLLSIVPTTSVYGREKTYSFLHLTLQEYCAARYSFKKLPYEEQRDFLKYKLSHIDSALCMFYSSFTGLRDKKTVDCIVPYGQRLINIVVVHLINCAYEAHSATACELIGNVLDGTIDLTGCGTYVLLPAFNYFLKQLHIPIKVLKISSSDVNDESFMEFLSLLEERLSKHIDTNLILEAADTMISQKSYFLLAELLANGLPIVELCISKKQNILDTQVKYRIRSASSSKFNRHLSFSTLKYVQPLPHYFATSKTLRVLDVSGLNIGPEGAAYLAGCRGVVLRELKILGCKLGPTGADKIGEMVYYNTSITSVNLAYNKIGNRGVKNLVCHLEKCTNVQILYLEGNNISAIGARHLRRLIRKSLISVELSHNPLRDKGVHLVLQVFTVIMDHIGLISVEMTSSSIPYIAVALDKVKSISFTIPCFIDYEVIIDSLAKTSVLECLELHLWGGFKPKYKTMKVCLKHRYSCSQTDPFHDLSHQVSLYRNPACAPQSKKLQLYYGMSYFTKSVQQSGASSSCLKLDIRHFKSSILPKDLPLVESYRSNISFSPIKSKFTLGPINKKKQDVASSVDKAFALLILLQLKRQTFTLRKLTLRLSSKLKTSYDIDFSLKADRYIEQINKTRRNQGITDPLLVKMIFEGK